MANNIFISYRKDDSRWNSQLLYNELLKYFPKKCLFKDFNTIFLGANYVKAIDQALGKSGVMVVVIGKNWVDAKDENGVRRLTNPNDFVRLEVGTALKREIGVIPLLFDNVSMPSESLLPEDLKTLVFQQSLSVTDLTFEADIEKLAHSLKEKIKPVVPSFILWLLKFRIAIIPLIVVTIVFLLNRIINFADLEYKFVGLSLIISFAVNLAISFIVDRKERKIGRSASRLINSALMLLLIIALSMHFYNFYGRTYEVKTRRGLATHVVKGSVLTTYGSKLKASLTPQHWSESDIIRDTLGGDATIFWEPSSIHENKLIIFGWFTVAIICLSALISLSIAAFNFDYRYE